MLCSELSDELQSMAPRGRGMAPWGRGWSPLGVGGVSPLGVGGGPLGFGGVFLFPFMGIQSFDAFHFCFLLEAIFSIPFRSILAGDYVRVSIVVFQFILILLEVRRSHSITGMPF